jgi:hypothetical protein
MFLVTVALEELSFIDRALALVKYVKVSINCNSFQLLDEVKPNKKLSSVSTQDKTNNMFVVFLFLESPVLFPGATGVFCSGVESN